MIKLDLSQKLYTLQGLPMTINGESAELGNFLAEIVIAPHETKKGFRPLQALELSRKMIKGGEIELETSTIVVLKDVLEGSKVFGPLVVGQIQEMIIKAESDPTQK